MRGKKGPREVGRKLTDEQVDLIRWLVGINQHELARHFGVSPSAINEIQSGKKRIYGREKELHIFGNKEARTIASRLRRTSRAKDTGKEIGSSGKKRRKDWATRKTSQDFEKTLELRRANPKWVRSIEKFKEYHKRPDAMYHARINALKTHCKRRHALVGANVYAYVYQGRPRRRCVTCFEATWRKHYAKKNAIRKAHSLGRRRIEAEEGVREQQGSDLRNIEQDKIDEGK